MVELAATMLGEMCEPAARNTLTRGPLLSSGMGNRQDP